jgi:hypothetical protein
MCIVTTITLLCRLRNQDKTRRTNIHLYVTSIFEKLLKEDVKICEVHMEKFADTLRKSLPVPKNDAHTRAMSMRFLYM